MEPSGAQPVATSAFTANDRVLYRYRSTRYPGVVVRILKPFDCLGNFSLLLSDHVTALVRLDNGTELIASFDELEHA
jgi:hypothetical protein